MWFSERAMGRICPLRGSIIRSLMAAEHRPEVTVDL